MPTHEHAWLLSTAAQQAVFAALSEGLVVHAEDGRVVDANPAACRILGLSREQLLGLDSMDPRWQVLTEDGHPLPGKQHPAMRALRGGEAVQGFVISVSLPDGTRRWLRVNATPIFEAGVARGAVASFEDISATRELLTDLSDLYENAPFGYHALDAQRRFVRINATALQWLGCEREALIGRLGPADFLDDAGRALLAEQFPRLQREGRIDGLEVTLYGRQGAIRQVRVSATVLRDAAGGFVRTRSVMVDVSAEHTARQRIRQLLNEQAAMLDNDLIGMVRLRDRHTVWANRAMERTFGYAPGSMVGRSAREIYPSDEAYEVLGRAAYPVLSAGATFRTQTAMRRRDGSALWIDLCGVQLSEQEALWMLVDLTALHEHEQQLAHAAHHDLLTGLPNRLLLGDRLQGALALAAREGHSVALVYMDLDGFKGVNDGHGHAAGDQLLKALALRLLACMRAHDTVSRLGGDEFVLVLSPLEQEADLAPLLERVQRTVAEPVPLGDGLTVRVGSSLGVALYPQDARDKGLLLRLADQAMYSAKQAGRGRWARALVGPA